MHRTPAERIDELLKANEDYRQRAIETETMLKGMDSRLKFWIAECEKHSSLREEAQNEAPREVLLHVIEWLRSKGDVATADNLQRESNLKYEIIGQMHRLKTAQRRA